jgi:alpha-tubulin suppressor-like RCC1 family protein
VPKWCLLIVSLLFLMLFAAPAGAVTVAPTITAVASNSGHTCALATGGWVLCWGQNEYGQLGDGTTTSRSTPVLVTGLASGVTAIAADYSNTCALTSGAGVLCWGYNSTGELGDGKTTNSWAPVPVTGLTSGVTAIAAGGQSTCALTSTGGVLCWGWNGDGELGDGTTSWRSTPVPVTGLASGVTAIAAGGGAMCALTSAGGVFCWGYNRDGELGNGTTTNSSTPVQVTGLTRGVTAIAAEAQHVCALTSAGGVLCWGYNVDGELGNGTTTNSSTPVQVTGLTRGVTAIATGANHTCALTSAGGVLCWGYNVDGELGDGTTTARSTPGPVTGLTGGVTAIAAGVYHTCALTSAGAVLCWGYNVDGELGDGTTTARSTPVPVAFPQLSAPSASISAPLDNEIYTLHQPVATEFSCSESLNGPGIRSCADSNGTSSPNGQLDTTTVGPHSYTVTAVSVDGLTSTAGIHYLVVGPPSASITSPTSGTTYVQGTAAGTSFVCMEAANGPGIASCSDSGGHSSPAGSLDTAALGAHTYTVTATSRDGLATSASISYIVVPPPPPSATLTVTSTSGATVTLVVACQGYAGQECADELALSATVRERDRTVISVIARKRSPGPPSDKTIRMPVASAAFSVPAGQSAPVHVSLNATGRQLLGRFYKLSARISSSGTPVTSPAITFAYPLATPPPDASWAGWTWLNEPCAPCYTTVDNAYFFGVPRLLATATVRMTCAGQGCPGPRTFGPRTRPVKLNELFAGRRLSPGSVIRLVITAPGSVGRIVSYTMIAGQHPKRSALCLPPGARQATACAPGA